MPPIAATMSFWGEGRVPTVERPMTLPDMGLEDTVGPDGRIVGIDGKAAE